VPTLWSAEHPDAIAKLAIWVPHEHTMSSLGREDLSDSYPAVPASVPLARMALADFAAAAGAKPDRIDSIRLAASEALTNVVLHAYDSAEGAVHISAASVSGELWILVADDGDGLRVRTDSPGLGVGLSVIAQLSDDFALVNRACGGTEVRMRFTLNSDEAPPSDHSWGSDETAARPASPVFSTTT
jgi:anti-sigma regulatory factor (Ser/Thr protein kinase)